MDSCTLYHVPTAYQQPEIIELDSVFKLADSHRNPKGTIVGSRYTDSSYEPEESSATPVSEILVAAQDLLHTIVSITNANLHLLRSCEALTHHHKLAEDTRLD